MTCEININTSAVWSIGNYMKSNGRTNYDTLWRDINNLDSALDSLRSFNNSSGSVSSLVDSAQQSLGRCRSYCIGPTSNAMNNLASFLQSVAVQYEQTEREVCNIWSNRITSNSIDVGNAFGTLFDTLRRGAESAFDHVADFVGDCIDNAIKYMHKNPVGFVLDCIAVVGGIALIAAGPVGWGLGLAILAVNVIPSVYSIFSGGHDMWNDLTVVALTPVLGEDKAKTAGSAMSIVGAGVALVVPSGAGISKIYTEAKKIQNATKGSLFGSAKQFVSESKTAYMAKNEISNMSTTNYLMSRYLSAYRSNAVGDVVKNPLIKGPSQIVQKVNPSGPLKKALDSNPAEAILNGLTHSKNADKFNARDEKLYEIINNGKNKSGAVYDNIDALHGVADDLNKIKDALTGKSKDD